MLYRFTVFSAVAKLLHCGPHTVVILMAFCPKYHRRHSDCLKLLGWSAACNLSWGWPSVNTGWFLFSFLFFHISKNFFFNFWVPALQMQKYWVCFEGLQRSLMEESCSPWAEVGVCFSIVSCWLRWSEFIFCLFFAYVVDNFSTLILAHGGVKELLFFRHSSWCAFSMATFEWVNYFLFFICLILFS